MDMALRVCGTLHAGTKVNFDESKDNDSVIEDVKRSMRYVNTDTGGSLSDQIYTTRNLSFF